MEDKYIGLILALVSSCMIGISFVVTKMGLIDSTQNGGDAHAYSYLKNGIWWIGLSTMAFGEVANFAAYSFAPAILVTPLGALSVIIGAILASVILKEKLDSTGKVGCALCILGSIIIVLHAPKDKTIQDINEIVAYAVHPAFVTYSLLVLAFCLVMIYYYGPKYGKKYPLVYISICSLIGSITVMASKGFGIALKLTLSGNNQLWNPATYIFAITTGLCILTQMNYFNKALDTFSTNVVTPIYYVFFTTATLTASVIFFRGFEDATPVEAVSLLIGFLVIFSGVFLLNDTNNSDYNPLTTPDTLERENCTQIYRNGSVHEEDLYKPFDEEGLGLSETNHRRSSIKSLA
ncbi:DUF803-domain-containing protein [Neoconidiobolus thromboides FSU 785]|nr:DUF803-domain-containing protein [Neoconidiobolus thromboides FSU 785]